MLDSVDTQNSSLEPENHEGEAPVATAAPEPAPAQAAPMLHAFVAQITDAARQMENECAKRLAGKENASIDRAKHFLHEAGQWLEKAAKNLAAAGV